MNSFTLKKSDSPEIIRKTLALAERWQNQANTLFTKNEKNRQKMMSRLLNNPSDKTVEIHLVDQSFRSGAFHLKFTNPQQHLANIYPETYR